MGTHDPNQAGPLATLEAIGRRRHYRVGCAIRVGYVFTRPEGGPSGEATMINVGLGGARIDFPNEVCLPAEVLLRLPVEPGAAETAAPLELKARVVWTVADQDGGPYPTGLQFRELGDRDRRRLYDLIGALMRQG